MRLQPSALVALAALATTASAIVFDVEDTPKVCRDICVPLTKLVSQCRSEVGKADGDLSDAQEEQLEAECVCGNENFGVSSVAEQCQGCILGCLTNPHHLSTRDDDEEEELIDTRDEVKDALHAINDIITMCSFSPEAYDSASATATAISVEATVLSSTDNLTTSYSNIPTTIRKSSSDDDDDDDNDDDDDDDGDNAAATLAPLWVAGGLVAGVMALMA
ncbi:hypothetical protein GMORB2_0664 [Geosmithia morbida]|uniref:Protein CAP22 n=1 Tax=Geosmithia morbida TaxID=1094350 RepID=A0A9P4Z2E4_9HYPO|nr:uncharacterized protein GMORB2_0664 [Geosmithia morbida]KAF4126927.1 hypothetical protein GMORB2_0664 [Geosmithia morbida]